MCVQFSIIACSVVASILFTSNRLEQWFQTFTASITCCYAVHFQEPQSPVSGWPPLVQSLDFLKYPFSWSRRALHTDLSQPFFLLDDFLCQLLFFCNQYFLKKRLRSFLAVIVINIHGCWRPSTSRLRHRFFASAQLNILWLAPGMFQLLPCDRC